MRKIRKRIFGAVLAAALLFTMPGTASVEARENVPESVTEQTEPEADATETLKLGTDVIPESETDDSDKNKPETADDDTEELIGEKSVSPLKENTAECICGTLCTEDNINPDCSVCGAEGADLSACKGRGENEEENTEVTELKEAETEETNLCAHHKDHTENCGFIPATEDGEGSPCTYECRICPIEELIAALPDMVTEDNAEKVRAQLDEILALYAELTEEEQEQIDLSRCYELQGALDEANAPMPAEGHIDKQAGDEASVTIGGETLYYATLEEAFTAENSGATVTLLSSVTLDNSLDVTANFILNLKGHAIAVNEGNAPAIHMTGGALTIKGRGTIKSRQNHGILVQNNAALTVKGEGIQIQTYSQSHSGIYVEGGTVDVHAGATITSRNNADVHAALSVSAGTVTIHRDPLGTGTSPLFGGGVSATGSGVVTLNGGTFDDYDGKDGVCVASSGNGKIILGGHEGKKMAFYKNDTPIVSEAQMKGTVTVKTCNHTGEGVCEYRPIENTGTHSKTCLACGTELGEEPCSYVDGVCGCGSKLEATFPADLNLTYDGTAREPGVTVTVDGQKLAEEKYTVSYANNTNAGEASVTISDKDGAWNFEQKFNIAPAPLTITAHDQTIIYGGSIAEGTAQVSTGTFYGGDTLQSITLTPSTANVPGGVITPSIAVITRGGEVVTGNYRITYSDGTLTINKAKGELTVPETAVTKKFGDGQFLLNCSTNGDGKISYASSNEGVASVSEDETVRITGAGKTVITATLEEGTNHTGGASRKITLTVAKAAAPIVTAETRNYTFLKGSGGAVIIDVAGKLPKDRGETKYTCAATDAEGILSGVSVDDNGNLAYTVQGNKKIGDTASVTVTAEMANYKTATFTVKIALVEKKTVELQAGSGVSIGGSGILIYGQTLSELKPGDVIFVEQGTDREVKGTLVWKDGSSVPNVQTTEAEWIFIPADSAEYAEITGAVSITVKKAVPDVEIPVADAVIYNPSGKLGSVALIDGSAAWTVGGSTVAVEGAWGWQSADTVPTVNNSGYATVFTPKDTANYETVIRTITVHVTKAVPYIADPPIAAEITYGDTLSASELSGGTVQYGSGTGQAGSGTDNTQAVQGAFTWKAPATKPTVADSRSTEYAVVFIPADSTNYNRVETEIKLVIEPAEDAPNMPSDTMKAAKRCEKVSDVELPPDWQWTDEDKETVLEIGVPVTATAVYTGADKENYKKVTVIVVITKADCGHENTEYRNVAASTCQKKGYSGDIYCLDCGELLVKGNETPPAGHSGGTATCVRGRICQVCGTEYTGKDSNNHGSTELRKAVAASCTMNGYTGDNYCTDCKAKINSGIVIRATGHDWHITVEESATTASEGKRVYTCSKCGRTKEETIPKLPSKRHKHDYTSTVTKEASSTEAGIKTYTCIRYGDSYTEPIEKLKDTSAKSDRRLESGKPFIKEDCGKEGWTVIREETDKAEEKSTLTVDMNGSTVVPKDVLENIRGRDITIIFDMGNGILWSVNGKDISGDKSSDIDFSVKTGTGMIPDDVIGRISEGHCCSQFSLAHEGEFGCTAVLTIGIGKENGGRTAALYYYNEDTGELEPAGASEAAEDGMVSFAFTHASVYAVILDAQMGGVDAFVSGPGTEAEPDGERGDVQSPKNGQPWKPWWFIVAAGLALVIGTGAFAVTRKKENSR